MRESTVAGYQTRCEYYKSLINADKEMNTSRVDFENHESFLNGHNMRNHLRSLWSGSPRTFRDNIHKFHLSKTASLGNLCLSDTVYSKWCLDNEMS